MKKITFAILALAIIIVSVPLFSAFEAHVINVTATIENALQIRPDAITFGTVFPQEQLDRVVTIALSESAAQSAIASVQYIIKQKPKCAIDDDVTGEPFAQATEDAEGRFVCPKDYHALPLLCPYLSKHSPKTTDTSISAFHGPLADWTDAISNQFKALGTLTKESPSTDWIIDLKVPCFAGMCAQDWTTYVRGINPDANPTAYIQPAGNEHEIFGCDLWFEVVGIYTGDENGAGGSCGTCTPGNYCTGQSVCAPQVDGDHDGFFSIATGGDDCDDGNAPNHPGAVEVCDLRDNNCDGQADEGNVCVCTPLTGHTCPTGKLGICSGGMSDCADDGSGWSECIQVNQPTTEVCDDGSDNDCDGQIDEGCIAPTLFFSEYIEGSSNNKAIEIYNPTGSSVDLSGYKIDKYVNGSASATNLATLPSVSLAAGDVYVVCDDDSDAAILAQCDFQASAVFYNGDDAVALKDSTNNILDVIGQIGNDPGTQWGSGLTSTADNTIVRKCGIVHGDPNGSDAFDPATEWNGYAVDTFGNLGLHDPICH